MESGNEVSHRVPMATDPKRFLDFPELKGALVLAILDIENLEELFDAVETAVRGPIFFEPDNGARSPRGQHFWLTLGLQDEGACAAPPVRGCDGIPNQNLRAGGIVTFTTEGWDSSYLHGEVGEGWRSQMKNGNL